MSANNRSNQELERLLGIEECIRYYPPGIVEVKNADEIFGGYREIDIYIHLPFCKTPCSFCPFNKYLYDEAEVKIYLLALEREVEILKKLNDFSRIRIKTIWIGGGTPTDLSEEDLEWVLKIIHGNFSLDYVDEFTIEGKPMPNLFTEAKLDLLQRYRVNRISLGVQSTADKYLKLLGRGYRPGDVLAMVKKIKERNFILNIDMIYRLPGQTDVEVVAEVNRVKSLGIDHFSWFPYITHPGTAMASRVQAGKLPQRANRALYLKMFNSVIETMGSEGYSQYTPYYFAKEHKCQYHIDRWQMPQLETMGIGAGAFSFFNGWIYANAHNVKQYIEAVENQQAPVVMGKKLSTIEQLTRLMVLGIKYFTVNLNEFERLSGVKLTTLYHNELLLLEEQGLIEVTANEVRCTNLGKAFNNDLAYYFSTDLAKSINQPQAVDLIKKGL